MPAITGIIETVHSKELDQEDSYGNTFRTSIKLDDGEWYGLGGGKKPEVNIKHNGGWHTLAEGDQVTIVYSVNGKYRNAKRSTITLEAAGSGGSKPAARSSGGSGAQNGAVAGGKGGSSSGLAGIKVGHALNNAVQLAIAEGNVSSEVIKAHACTIIRLSVELESEFDAIVAGNEPLASNAKVGAAKKKAPAKKQPEPAEEYEEQDEDDEFGDDVPF